MRVPAAGGSSRCGATPQYEQLQQLHEKYSDKGLAILGFPCNQFAGQEPGTAAEIQEFCKKNYEDPLARGDESATSVVGPLGPCRKSILTAVKKWNEEDVPDGE